MIAPNVDFFETHVDEKFLHAVASAVRRVYKTAPRKCGRLLPEEQASNLLPFFRWCMLDAELKEAAELYGMKATNAKNGGGFYYVQVSNERVTLTASYVGNPSEFPRSARYRETIARTSQPPLSPDWIEEPSHKGKLYAILIHAPDQEQKTVPMFATIRFPAPGCKKWSEGKISLLDRFQSVTAAKRTFEVEEERVADEVLAQLRDDAAANAGKQDQI